VAAAAPAAALRISTNRTRRRRRLQELAQRRRLLPRRRDRRGLPEARALHPRRPHRARGAVGGGRPRALARPVQGEEGDAERCLRDALEHQRALCRLALPLRRAVRRLRCCCRVLVKLEHECALRGSASLARVASPPLSITALLGSASAQRALTVGLECDKLSSITVYRASRFF
jgi:hypothetical protein